MRKSNLLAAAAAALLVGGVAVAKKSDGSPKEKKICKVDRESKSRIPKKTCLTQAEWDQRTSQEALDDAAARLSGMGRNN